MNQVFSLKGMISKVKPICVYGVFLSGLLLGLKSYGQTRKGLHTIERPNILLILSDDHQADLIGAIGNPYIKTPHMDNLASKGMTFLQTFTQTPTCVPSRASLLTGCGSLTHKSFYPDYAAKGNETLEKWPRTMQKAGYTTFWTGKWNAHGSPKDWGIEKQSRIFSGGMGSHNMNFKEGDSVCTGFSSELFADALIEFLNQKHSKPFFATVAFTAPHDPRTPPGKYKDMYNPYEVPLPANFYSSYPYEDGYSSIRDEKLLAYPRQVDIIRREIAQYYGLISHMDTQIGRIIQAVEQNGLNKNTIIIYASDNGLALGHHGLLGKMSFYRHSLNVPMVISGPKIPENIRTDSYVYLHDLYPTICEMTGIKIPKTVESKSFLSIINGNEKVVHEYMYGALGNLKRAVTTKRFKLIRHYSREDGRGPSKDEYLFYDLENDPLEIVNEIDNPLYVNEIRHLKKKLGRWQKEKHDFLPPVSYTNNK